MKRILQACLLTLGSFACVGEGVDTTYTRSNCPWRSDADFAGAGYNLYHQAPSYCPVDVIAGSAATVYYSAIVTGPSDAETITTSFFNANLQLLLRRQAVFFTTGGVRRADPRGDYTAATVSVGLGQIRSDHALTFEPGVPGTAEVDLTYRGTGIRAVVPQSVQEGQQFTLQVAPQGGILVEPIVYQWFKDGQALGDPTTSHSFSTQIFGSGMTVVFTVEATDAIGQVSNAKGWVSVPANCGNPPCPEQ